MASKPSQPECIVPGSPGGGNDMACQLLRDSLATQGSAEPLRVTYMPGGVGAVTYNTMVLQRPVEDDTLVAWSSGSLLNLAQRKFGRFDETAVRWVAAVGKSYGAIAVRSDSPYKTLNDLVTALKRQPRGVLFGSGGTAGSQDWVQAALLAKAANVDVRNLRYIALEGGGESAVALLNGHIDVSSTDVFESIPFVRRNDMRLLAVLSEQRLDGELKDIPTAREQGFDIVCPVVRGYYLGPNVSDQTYQRWKEQFDRQLASPTFAKLRSERRLLPFALTGEELQQYVKQQVADYKVLVKELGLEI